MYSFIQLIIAEYSRYQRHGCWYRNAAVKKQANLLPKWHSYPNGRAEKSHPPQTHTLNNNNNNTNNNHHKGSIIKQQILVSETTGRWKLANGQTNFFRNVSGWFLLGKVFEQRFEESRRSKENSCVYVEGAGVVEGYMAFQAEGTENAMSWEN